MSSEDPASSSEYKLVKLDLQPVQRVLSLPCLLQTQLREAREIVPTRQSVCPIQRPTVRHILHRLSVRLGRLVRLVRLGRLVRLVRLVLRNTSTCSTR